MAQLCVFGIISKEGSSIDDLWYSIIHADWIEELTDVNVKEGTFACKCLPENAKAFVDKFGDSGHLLILEDDDYTVLTNAFSKAKEIGTDYAEVCRRYIRETTAIRKVKEEFPDALTTADRPSTGSIMFMLSCIAKQEEV